MGPGLPTLSPSLIWSKLAKCAATPPKKISGKAKPSAESGALEKGAGLLTVAAKSDEPSRRQSPNPEQKGSEILKSKRDAMDTVILVRRSTARAPMPLNLDKLERYMKSIDVATSSCRVAGVLLWKRYPHSI